MNNDFSTEVLFDYGTVSLSKIFEGFVVFELVERAEHVLVQVPDHRVSLWPGNLRKRSSIKGKQRMNLLASPLVNKINTECWDGVVLF